VLAFPRGKLNRVTPQHTSKKKKRKKEADAHGRANILFPCRRQQQDKTNFKININWKKKRKFNVFKND
jgi:hypothetical protein